MRRTNKGIELINYEGACLTARKKEDSILIYDQWGRRSMSLDHGSLIEWVDGKINIADTSGKIWIYSEHKGEAIISRAELIDWLEE